jgi:hypothetical protein
MPPHLALETFRLAGRSAALARHAMLPGAWLCWPLHVALVNAVWGPPPFYGYRRW